LIFIFDRILKTMNKNTLLLIGTTVLVASLSRMLPHLPNFTPLIAMSLMAGSAVKNTKLSMLMVLLSMFVSDVLTITFINSSYSSMSDYFFSATGISVYVSLIAIVLFGKRINEFKMSGNTVAAALSSGMFFWLVTNFATWASGLWYVTDVKGLQLCYINAIPFLPNQLLGDVLFTLAFAGLFNYAQKLSFFKPIAA